MIANMLRTCRLLLFVLTLAACSSDDGNAQFLVRESVEQVHVTHATPGAALELIDQVDAVVQSGTADALGSVIFREVPPASGYRVRTTTVPEEISRHLTVMSVESSQPDAKFYRKRKLVAGFQYITTRDGTTLSAYVTLPGDIDTGPFPTVVSYSGYSPSKPGEPIEGQEALCPNLPVLCDAPNDPSALMAGLFGYATVNVNIRGTGCSGGAFDYFERLQLLDGYDVIETVAAQDWVLHHKVGMVGLSYPGITQLFVASTRPPGLAAIAPFSVIGNSATTVFAGGILNEGFALEWVDMVISQAVPYGQGWEQEMVDAGDTECAENQLLHGQLIDNVEQARTTTYYDPAEHDRYNPTRFAGEIEVPVFLACAFQDEQTGPYFFTLLDRFTGAPAQRLNIYNGVHVDGFQPHVLAEWRDFLELYVAGRVPIDVPIQRAMAPILFKEIFGTSGIRLPDERWADYATVDEAIAAWQAEPPVRVLFESGAGKPVTGNLGAPIPTFERSFAAWPPAETSPRRLYFQADGGLGDDGPTEAFAASTFQLDPAAGARGILAPGGDVWDMLPAYDWRQPAPGSAVIFESAPLAEDLVMLGSASVDLWLRSPVDDADLEVSLTEVRPDEQEMYVQSGWLRASTRGLAAGATELWPEPTFEEPDAAPLVPGEWTEARVGVPAFAHVFRAGSRIRVSVDTPGDSRASWRFDLQTFDAPVGYDIGHDAGHPSSVVLPVLAGMAAPTELPFCPSLRGQQCREYQVYTNVAATP